MENYPSLRILVCGDRNWEDKELIYKELESFLPLDVTIIHGACKGADFLAGQVASELGMKVEVYPADWSLGHKAGPIRNQKMLEKGKPDLVMAFHDYIFDSRGTKDMVSKAVKSKIKCVVFSHFGMLFYRQGG